MRSHAPRRTPDDLHDLERSAGKMARRIPSAEGREGGWEREQSDSTLGLGKGTCMESMQKFGFKVG